MRHTVSHAEFMADAHRWPGLFLPIKRWVNGKLETAYLTNPVPVIYYGSIYFPSPHDPKRTYDSFDAIAADGWRVD